MKIFEWLTNYFESNARRLSQSKITFFFWDSTTKTDNPAQVVDIDTETRMARVTLWESGDCNFEALEDVTGEMIFFEHQIIKSEKELMGFLDKTFAKL